MRSCMCCSSFADRLVAADPALFTPPASEPGTAEAAAYDTITVRLTYLLDSVVGAVCLIRADCFLGYSPHAC